jgi:hypothetical protein
MLGGVPDFGGSHVECNLQTKELRHLPASALVRLDALCCTPTPQSATVPRSALERPRVERAGKPDVGAGDGLLTVRSEGDRDQFQPGIEAEIGVVVLRGDGADQVVKKSGNLLEVLKDEVAREHRLASVQPSRVCNSSSTWAALNAVLFSPAMSVLRCHVGGRYVPRSTQGTILQTDASPP